MSAAEFAVRNDVGKDNLRRWRRKVQGDSGEPVVPLLDDRGGPENEAAHEEVGFVELEGPVGGPEAAVEEPRILTAHQYAVCGQ